MNFDKVAASNNTLSYISVKVFKNGPIKIFGRQPLKCFKYVGNFSGHQMLKG